jgi:beta-aspartyl-peptidase (threonine type)
MPSPAIVVHGGAGGRAPDDDRPHREALVAALDAAREQLGAGALAAARAAVEVLEDFPRFNAGRGSVLHGDGTVEMDAAVMCGRTRSAGAVAAVTRARHPIALAHAVMERTEHVLIAGPAADRLAAEWGLALEDPEWFVTERQRQRWEARHPPPDEAGTVGAVVLDADGHLAAASSTGGRADQRPGRVGDSPIVGAGLYAEDGVCAISATGDGEQFMRAVVSHEVAALIRHRGTPLREAAQLVLRERVEPLGGHGGVIAVGPEGEVATPFTTGVMFRGLALGDEPARVAVGPEPPEPMR